MFEKARERADARAQTKPGRTDDGSAKGDMAARAKSVDERTAALKAQRLERDRAQAPVESSTQFKKQPKRASSKGKSVAISDEARQAYEEQIRQRDERERTYLRHLPLPRQQAEPLTRPVTIEIRQASHPDATRRYDTAELRRHFLVQDMFRPGEVSLTYSHIERFVIGGAAPTGEPLVLPAPKPLGTPSFLARRELGVFNIGGTGRVRIGAASYDLACRDALYAGMGAGEVSFESADPATPAKFYLLSTPAHAAYDTVVIPLSRAKTMNLGDQSTGNRRTISQMIHPDICRTCQLVMGMTRLDEGSLWNTMPTHVHDRRSEAYLYFDLAADARVIHLMGEPAETRHLVVANEEAILSPNWSIHSGVGTRAYSFIWGMGGDNVDYTDMDPVTMDMLR